MRYTEHPLAQKLKDSSIYDYKPEWTKNTNVEYIPKENITKITRRKRKRSFDSSWILRNAR